jgi:hypothetical protein
MHLEDSPSGDRWNSFSPKLNVWCTRFRDEVIGTFVFSREDHKQQKLSRYDRIICRPADGTPSAKRFPFNRMVPLYTGTLQCECLIIKLLQTHGLTRPWPSRSLTITTLEFVLLGLCKEPSISSVLELGARILQCSCLCDIRDTGKHWHNIEYRLDILRATNGVYIVMY